MIWIIGFIWGCIVFSTPALSAIPSIEYISKMPAITLLLFVVLPILAIYFTKAYLKDTKDKAEEAKLLGITFLMTNLALDLAMYLTIYDKDYYSYLSIWIYYALLLGIPYYIGKRIQASEVA
ncbi:hypothetical protein [Methanococcoides sp.]|uniref:hypothetical protein n=1 Tax=Methanococcoides sp. TaxID=1966350 RepID=UPI00272E7A77|nr:hypothetical protein [Methanococcoides sp.]